MLEKRDEFKHVMLGELLCDLEQLDMSASELQRDEHFPLWLHLARRRDVALGEVEEEDEWHGRIKAFNKALEAGNADLGLKLKVGNDDLGRKLNAELKVGNDELRKEMEELKSQVGDLSAKMDRHMEAVTQLLTGHAQRRPPT